MRSNRQGPSSLRASLPRGTRWRILLRDNFTCQYCGSRPGSSVLHVDHMIPRSLGGSDGDANLVAACASCNLLKSDTVSIPDRLCLPQTDEDGWRLWKVFGRWEVRWSSDVRSNGDPSVALCYTSNPFSTWIGIWRCREPHLIESMGKKLWMKDAGFKGFCDGMDFLVALWSGTKKNHVESFGGNE